MSGVRKFILNTSMAAGGLLAAFGGASFIFPEFHETLSSNFEAAAETGSRPPGGRYAGIVGGIVTMEPATSLMIGTALFAYGAIVPDKA